MFTENNLTEAQKQVLLICQEECAEVTQSISKIFRFGIDAKYNDRTNRERLTEEVGDLLCMIYLMQEKGIIDELETNEASWKKRKKLHLWSNIFENYQRELFNSGKIVAKSSYSWIPSEDC